MTPEQKIQKLLELCEQNNFKTLEQLAEAFRQTTEEPISRATLDLYTKQGKLPLHKVVVKGVGFNILKPIGATDADGNLYQTPQEHLRKLSEDNFYTTKKQLHEAFAQQFGLTIIYRKKKKPLLLEGTPTVTDLTLEEWCRSLDLQYVVVKDVGFNIVKPKGAKDADGNLYQTPQYHIQKLALDNHYTEQQLDKAVAQQFGLTIIYRDEEKLSLPKGTLTVSNSTLNTWRNNVGLQEVVVKGVGFKILKPKGAKDADGSPYLTPQGLLQKLALENNYTREQLLEAFAQQSGLPIVYTHKGNPSLPEGIPTVTEDILQRWCRNLSIYPLVQVDQDAEGRITKIHGHAVMKPKQPGWMAVNDVVIRCISQNKFTSNNEVAPYFDRIGLRSGPSQSYTKSGIKTILDRIGCERVNGVIIAPTNAENKKIIWTYYQNAQFNKLLDISQQTKYRIVQLFNSYLFFTSWDQFNTLFYKHYPNAKANGKPYAPNYLPDLARQMLGVKEIVIKDKRCFGLVPPTNTSYLTVEETLLRILQQEIVFNQTKLRQHFETITGIKVSPKFISLFCKANDIVSDLDTTTGRKRLQQVKKADAGTNLSSKVKKEDNGKLTDAQNSSSDSGPQNSANQNPHSESSHTLEKDVEKLIKSTYAKMPTDPAKHADQHNKLVQKLRNIQRRHELDEKQFKKLYKLVTGPNPGKKTIKEILTGKTKKEVEKQTKIFEVFTPEKQKSTTEWSYPAAYPFEKEPNRTNTTPPRQTKVKPPLRPTRPSLPTRVPVGSYSSLGPFMFLTIKQQQQKSFSVRAQDWAKRHFVYDASRMQKLASLSKGAGYVNLGFLSAHVTKDLIHLGNDETRTEALKSLGYTGTGVAGFYGLSRVAPLAATYLGIGFAGLNMVTIAIPTAVIGYAVADGISEKVAPFMVAYAKNLETPKHDCAVHPDPFFTPDRFYQHQASKRPLFKVEVSPKSDLYFTTRKADWDPNKFMVYIGKKSHTGLTDNHITQVTKDKTLQMISYVVLPYATTKPEEVIIEGKTYQWAYYNPASAVTGDDYWTLNKEEAQAGIEALNKSDIYTVGCSCRTRPLVYPYGLNEPTKGTRLIIEGNKVQLTGHADKTLTSFVQEINTYRQQQDRAEVKIPYAFFYVKSLPMLKPLFAGYAQKALMAQE